MSEHPTKHDVLNLMQRLGLRDRIPRAEEILPDVVDLQRDEALLQSLGLSAESAMNELGSSP